MADRYCKDIINFTTCNNKDCPLCEGGKCLTDFYKCKDLK